MNALGANGGIFDTNGNNVSFASPLSGSGTLTKDGAGSLTLSGANTFSGELAVDNGTLALTANGSLQTSSLALGTGAVFDYSVATAYNSASPSALKNTTIRGLDTKIIPNAGHLADFTSGTLSFLLPQNTIAGDLLLSVNGNANMTGTTIRIDTPTGRPSLAIGDSIILVNVGGTLTSDLTHAPGSDPNSALTVQSSNGDIYRIELDELDDSQILAFLEKLGPNSPAYIRLKGYAESRAANLAFVNQGTDLLLNQGIASAQAATAGVGFRAAGFSGLSGGWSRYNSGSHVDVSGSSLLAGLALGSDVSHPSFGGRLTGGVFFETGLGNYSSQNSFSNAASVDGEGDTSYYGAGLLGRYDLTEDPLSGLYLDASLRMGWTESNFGSNDIQYNGWIAGFESSGMYYGLHTGLGYIWNISDKASVDASAKLLWTRQEGDSLTVYQDAVSFKDADSLRSRLGGRFRYAVNAYASPYFGAYWEHEFDGKVHAIYLYA